ncbi:hypothetical protein LIER_13136 [Lithospermum erythrorhizon]|uniref:Uncharacterized protein n=1 Tax=Lithospermum erythrorhizon TaxID=34254 RepID=A0AAV3PWC0_LITER
MKKITRYEEKKCGDALVPPPPYAKGGDGSAIGKSPPRRTQWRLTSDSPLLTAMAAPLATIGGLILSMSSFRIICRKLLTSLLISRSDPSPSIIRVTNLTLPRVRSDIFEQADDDRVRWRNSNFVSKGGKVEKSASLYVDVRKRVINKGYDGE